MTQQKSDPQAAITNFFQVCDAPEVSNQLLEVATMLQESQTFATSSNSEKTNLFFILQKIGRLVHDLEP